MKSTQADKKLFLDKKTVMKLSNSFGKIEGKNFAQTTVANCPTDACTDTCVGCATPDNCLTNNTCNTCLN